jgi:transketolase
MCTQVALGAYVLSTYGESALGLGLVLIATGTEVQLALKVAEALASEEGASAVRLVNLQLLLDLYE